MTVDADDQYDDEVRNPLSFDETLLRKSVEDGNDSVWGVIVHFEKSREQETFKASKVFGGRSREMRGKVETFGCRSRNFKT